MVSLQLPAIIQPGNLHWEAFRCAMRITRFPFRHFTEYDVFLDLQGPNGVLGSAMQFPLYQVTSSEDVLFPLACVTPATLAPGAGEVITQVGAAACACCMGVRRPASTSVTRSGRRGPRGLGAVLSDIL